MQNVDPKTMLNAALEYAERGWRVVPLHFPIFAPHGVVTCSCNRPGCSSSGKHPSLPRWPDEASADPNVVRSWFARMPKSNLGIALGTSSGIVSIDLDSEYGEQLLEQMSGGDLPSTCEMSTSRGKRRLLFAIPDGLETDPKTKSFADPAGGEALRFQSTGSQCVCPPSLHPSGTPYAWRAGRSPRDLEPAPMPAWLILQMCPTPPAPAPMPSSTVGEPFTPALEFNKRCDWQRDILMPFGFRLAYKRDDVEFYTRPGKSGGVSATLGHVRALDGTPAFHVFSGSIPELPAGKSYDAFGAYARLFHSGDFVAAGRALAARGFGTMGSGERLKPTIGSTNGRHTNGKPGSGQSNTPTDPNDEWIPQIITLKDVEPMETSWLWFQRIPFGCISLIAGNGGLGKSLVSLDLAARVSTGSKFPDGHFCTAGDVILLSGEDDPNRTIRPRLDAAGADLSRIHLLLGSRLKSQPDRERTFNLAHLDILEKTLESHPQTRLLIIDPIGDFVGEGVDSFKDTEVRARLSPVAALARKFNLAALLIAHPRKSTADRADDRVLGSRAFTALARSVLHVSVDPDDEAKERRLLLPGKSNLGQRADGLAFRVQGEPPRVEWEPGSFQLSADDALNREIQATAERRRPGRKPDARQEAKEWLESFLKSGSKTPQEVREAAELNDHSWRTIQRAASELGVDRQDRSAFHGATVWRLPSAEMLDSPRPVVPE